MTMRTVILLLAVFPVIVAARLWHVVAAPSVLATDSLAWDIGPRTAGGDDLPFLSQYTDVSAGPGLWLLTIGCALCVAGCLLPSGQPFSRAWKFVVGRRRTGRGTPRSTIGQPPGPEKAPPPAFT